VNYRRGLQRVYVTASVVWVLVGLALSIRDRPLATDMSPRSPDIPEIFNRVARDMEREARTRYWLLHAAIIAVPPPSGYFALFCVLPWIVRGFTDRTNDGPPQP
jgi:hypothetical protein